MFVLNVRQFLFKKVLLSFLSDICWCIIKTEDKLCVLLTIDYRSFFSVIMEKICAILKTRIIKHNHLIIFCVERKAKMNEYEKQETSKYEGIYTEEKVQLNNRLYSECAKKQLDVKAIEELLKLGADPLGATSTTGWGLLDHIYGEIILDASDRDSDSKNLPSITELFLKHGMDIDNPKVPYDGNNSLNPMWKLAFCINEDGVHTVKLFLDHGISTDSFAECWGHIVCDLINIECGDPVNDKFWNEICTYTLKIIMLGASYDYILEGDEDIRCFIQYNENSYDIHKFREWDNFYYEFDTSGCDNRPEFYKSVVTIYEKETKKEVWKMRIK